MKFVLMVYSNPRNWSHPMFLQAEEALAMSEAERAALRAQIVELFDEISENGEFVDGFALADPSTTAVSRVRDGVLTTTDGPFAETKEHLAGFFILDCASIERVNEIAGRFPDARFGSIVVRPLMDAAPPSEL